MRVIAWAKSRRFTFTSITLVGASLACVVAASFHAFERELGRTLSDALFPFVSTAAMVRHSHRLANLLMSVAVLLALAGLAAGIVAVRRKEPVVRSFAFAIVLLHMVGRLWSWIGELT